MGTHYTKDRIRTAASRIKSLFAAYYMAITGKKHAFYIRPPTPGKGRNEQKEVPTPPLTSLNSNQVIGSGFIEDWLNDSEVILGVPYEMS